MLGILKKWTLPIAIILGIVGYFVFAHCACFNVLRPHAMEVVSVVQPVLIFCMLFLSFCKIDMRKMSLRSAHLLLLFIQSVSFLLLGLVIYMFPHVTGRVIIEAGMLCMICPTATAAAVVTQKLGGDAADVTSYTLLINLLVAIFIPAFLPVIYPTHCQSFELSFCLILGKVFPVLICPLFLAQFVRLFCRKTHSFLCSFRNLAFYLWAVSLSIAIAVTTRSFVHTDHPLSELLGIAVVSFCCCLLQFALGRYIGKRKGYAVSTTQALGQKNTVFAIWLGYTFFNPVTSLAGGFYSIWHNLYNTWQMQRYHQKKHAKSGQ